MRDHGEVCEVPLYAGVEDDGGFGVAEGRPVLVQQVHQLFRHHPETQKSLRDTFRRDARKEAYTQI